MGILVQRYASGFLAGVVKVFDGRHQTIVQIFPGSASVMVALPRHGPSTVTADEALAMLAALEEVRPELEAIVAKADEIDPDDPDAELLAEARAALAAHRAERGA